MISVRKVGFSSKKSIKLTNQHWEWVYNNQRNNNNVTDLPDKTKNALDYVHTNHPVQIVRKVSVKVMLESYIQKSEKAGDKVINLGQNFGNITMLC